MTDYYAILGLPQNASDPEIKAAFKKLAVMYHPDKHAGDLEMEERFKEINYAYQVLSNPYEKARYDLQLHYWLHQSTRQETHTYERHSPPPPPHSFQRRSYKAPVNYRENWIATAYAFGFTLILATLVMGVIYTKQYIETRRFQEMLKERRSDFERAKEKYRTGEIETALSLINQLGSFLRSETDMETYKTELYESFVYQAERNYSQRNYKEAIYYLELLDKYAPRNPLPLQEHLVDAYRETGQPEKAIKKIKELLILDYQRMEMYIKMARIYHDKYDDPKEALHYYDLASELAIKKYKSFYGEGYPLVISGRHLPPEHYQLYTGLALACLETGNLERCIKATEWNTRMWPDSVANYIIAADGYDQLGNVQKACDNASIAVQLGYQGQFDFTCK